MLVRVLEVSLLRGPVPVLLLLSGCLALLGLTVAPGRRWWTRRVPLALLAGVVGTVALKVGVDVVWRPFLDPLPLPALLWTGLAGAALSLALLRSRRRRWSARALSVGAALVVLLTGAAQVNQHYRAYPTLRTALQLPFLEQVDPGRLTTAARQVVRPVAGRAMSERWRPPGDLPAGGRVSEVRVPGTVSGFAARRAWVYVPPAYLGEPRPLLPVLVLLAGQPGSPRDWLDGGRLIDTMDDFAAAHDGLAPVVVVADALGAPLAQTLCVDSRRGRAFTYLSVDVPAWIRAELQVDPDPAHWAVGGLSFGGTCALQLAVNAPHVYPTFVDVAGQAAPDAGSTRRTLAFFDGDAAAFRRVNPLDVLADGRAPTRGLAGFVVAGAHDERYRPAARRVHAALRRAAVDVRYVELPGGHSWRVWGPGLRRALPFLAVRGGLLPPDPAAAPTAPSTAAPATSTRTSSPTRPGGTP